MKKIFATILCLGVFFHANTVLIQFGKAVFRLLDREAVIKLVEKGTVVECKYLFENTVPVAIFSSTRAVVFPSMKEVPFKILNKVSKNKLSLSYRIKTESITNLFSGERCFTPGWKKVPLDELTFAPNGNKFFELEGRNGGEVLNVKSFKGNFFFSERESKILRHLGENYYKVRDDVHLRDFFTGHHARNKLKSVYEKAEMNFTEAKNREDIARKNYIDNQIKGSNNDYLNELENEYSKASNDQKEALNAYNVTLADYLTYRTEQIFGPYDPHKWRLWKIAGGVGGSVIVAGFATTVVCSFLGLK